MDNTHRGIVAAILFVIALWLLAALLPFCEPRARAQSAPRLTPELFLARVAVNEAGWDAVSRGDLYLIHEVFLRGAAHQQISYLSYARHYSQRVAGLRPSPSERIAWTMNLRPDGRSPQGWPTMILERQRDGSTRVRPHPPFSRFREAWLETLEAAREAVTTLTLDDVDEWGVCDGPVHDWGSPRLDRARAERLGLVEVGCGINGLPTRNDGWARPSRLNAEDVIDVD